MATGKSTYKVATRKDKTQAAAQAKNTALTINWDGATDEDLKAMSAKHIVIARQGFYRKHGIPTVETVNAKDFANGARQGLTPEVAQAVVLETAMHDPKARAALIAQLNAMK